MTDREALTAAIKYMRHETEHDHIAAQAARERLAQLPEKCEHGEDKPHTKVDRIDDYRGEMWECPGKVYPAELVERIARIIAGGPPGLDRRTWEDAVAVLDALNGETE